MYQGEEWQSFFDVDYLRFSEMILTPERTAVEAALLQQLLHLPAGSTVLDLGCGQGRLAIPLARSGYRVVGYDKSEPLLREAERRAREAGVSIAFQIGDMRDLNYDSEFDAVINVGTAFGYVQHESEDQDILCRIRRSLKPGGVFVQDTENRDRKITNRLGEVEHDMNGLTVCSTRTFQWETGRWRESISWVEGNLRKMVTLDLRLYAATELIRLVTNAGLSVLGAYGALDRSLLTLTSDRAVIYARRPQ